MLSIYILILGFFSGVSVQACPRPENIYPCKCSLVDPYHPSDMRVECNPGSEKTMPVKVLKHALSSLLRKRDVNLKLFNIEDTLPSNIFSGIGIKSLEFWSCRMDSLTNDDKPGLLGLENQLLNLGIYKSDLSGKKLHLGHLKKLRTLFLSGNNIPELEDDWLSDVPSSLTWLYYDHNNTTKIGSYAFSRLNSLQSLTLKNYRFGPIKSSMFPDSIEILNLENNALTDLPVDLFSRMPRINFIFLNKNRITTLDEDIWSSIWQQLRRVSLKDNNIVCDDRLNWIMKSKRRPEIYGACSSPKELENTSLEKFFRSKSR